MSSSSVGTYRPPDRPQSPSTGLHSPSEAAGIMSRLKDKRLVVTVKFVLIFEARRA